MVSLTVVTQPPCQLMFWDLAIQNLLQMPTKVAVYSGHTHKRGSDTNTPVVLSVALPIWRKTGWTGATYVPQHCQVYSNRTIVASEITFRVIEVFRSSGWYNLVNFTTIPLLLFPEAHRHGPVSQEAMSVAHISAFSMCRYTRKHEASVGFYMLLIVTDPFHF